MSVPDNVHREDWVDGIDHPRAVCTARELYEAVDQGAQDPVEAIEQLEAAAEPLWDSTDGDTSLVLLVADKMQGVFAAAERKLPAASPGRIAVRVRPMMLLARAQYRADLFRDAFSSSLAVLTSLEYFVEGAEALKDIIGRPMPNPVAEAAVAVLGLYPAALRRDGMPPIVREQYRARGIELVRAYMRTTGPAVIYPRTHALVSQWFYLLVEERRPGEQALVHLLYATDLATRPQSARGQATRGLRDAAFARYCDDSAGLKRNRRAAAEDLAAFGLPRHQEMVARYGYLAS